MFRLIVALSVVSAALAAVVNKEVTRVIDASTSVVRITTDIKAANVEGSYKFILANDLAKNLAFLSVTSKGKNLNVHAPVTHESYSEYTVDVSESAPNLKCVSVFTSALVPYPAEITQSESQYVRFTESHYFYSPYETETQKTTVKLASSNIESFTKLAPFSTKGSSIIFGSYKDVQPFEASPVTVHYMNNYPMAKFTSLTREYEVSHWGSIAVEEMYDLKHAGAVLKGGFSRFDYQMRRNAPTPSFRSLVTTLPGSATNIYYRDQIGNISTSEMKTDKNGDIELDVQARFPIFGGWQTQFYLGYMIPTENSLFVDSETGRFNLKFDFYTAFNDVWVEDMEIKVILPEGCTDIKVNVPYAVEQSTTKRFTYLDSELNGGRPVVILRAKNLVEEHDKQVIVSYNFEKSRMVVEPLMLISSFGVLFAILMFLGQTTKIARSFSKAALKGSSSGDLAAHEKSE